MSSSTHGQGHDFGESHVSIMRQDEDDYIEISLESCPSTHSSPHIQAFRCALRVSGRKKTREEFAAYLRKCADLIEGENAGCKQ